MIPIFPNIIQAVGTKTSAADETTKRPDTNGKKEESFASLMTQVLSPSGFGQPAKGLKSSAPGSSKDHAKTSHTNVSGDPVVDPNQVVLPDQSASILICPQNVSVPAPVPITPNPKSDQKSDIAVEGRSPAKAAPGIFTADLRAELNVVSGKVSSRMGVVKNVSERVLQSDLKIPSSKVSQKLSSVGPIALAEIDDTQTNAPLVKAITSDKLNPAVNSEVAAVSTAKLEVSPISKVPPPIISPANPIASEKLKSAGNNDVTAVSTIKLADTTLPKVTTASTAPAVLAAPEKSEPATKSANETNIKTADLILPELAPKAVTAATVAPAATAGQVQVESVPADTESENIAQLSLDADGTSIAKEDAAMKKVDKLNKFAGATEKILPGNSIMVARESNPPARADQSADIGSVGSSTSAPDSIIPFVTADSIAGSFAIDSRSHTLESVHELVVQHAMRMSAAGGDLLQVVIKPGAGTQLSLELRQHHDGVVVQAVLQHGDFIHLNQNWPELQQRLEQRGIRLAPLTADVNFAAGSGGHSFQQKQNQPAGALEEFAPEFSMAGTFARPATNAATHRGWETWA